MATFELSDNEARRVELGQLTIVIRPESSFGQEEPHLYARHYHGKTVDGQFQPLYFSEFRLTGQDFYQFLAEFQDLAGRYFSFWAGKTGTSGQLESE